MQNNTLTRLLMLILLSTFWAVSSYGQTGSQFTVTIPFDFYVSEKALPAGQYTFGRSTQASSDGIAVRETEGRAGGFVLTKEIQTEETQPQSKLVFRRYGDQYFLAEVWMSGRSTGRALLSSRKERMLVRKIAKQGAIPETVAVVADKR